MRTVTGLWAWRHNPLRRRTDLVEGWVALLGLVLILVLSPCVGVLAGSRTADALHQTVLAQHHDRQRVTATVLRPVRGARFDTDPESTTGRAGDVRVVASWAGPDGQERRGQAVAELRAPKVGDTFPVWTDARGGLLPRPLDGATAEAHAFLAGIGAAAGTAALLEGGRRLLLWRVQRWRLDAWEREWARTGPDWGRAGAGS